MSAAYPPDTLVVMPGPCADTESGKFQWQTSRARTTKYLSNHLLHRDM